jgi:hypothetical protein
MIKKTILTVLWMLVGKKMKLFLSKLKKKETL